MLDPIRSTALGYRLSLRNYRPQHRPDAPWRNAVLKTRAEWQAATAQVEALSLPSASPPQKNWDGLGMLACVLERTPREGRVLDAGAALYSTLLPWLFLYGYSNLTGVDLCFEKPVRRGPIRYEQGDITHTRFAEASFDVVMCQSVLEHGVDVDAFLREAARLLAPGGVLTISVDYFDEPIATDHLRPFGLPYRIFTPADIRGMIDSAERLNLRQTEAIDLACDERTVDWSGLAYTFVMLTFVKNDRRPGV